MKNKISKLFIILFFVFLTVVLNLKISELFIRKETRYNDFYKEKEDIDVFLLGNSHMYSSVFPMELYKDYGIVSYNYASQNAFVPISYWTLRWMLQYKKPKLVLLDLCYLSRDELCSDKFQQLHNLFDYFSLNKMKYELINDLFNENEVKRFEGRTKKDIIIEFLFPFSVYHNRWMELTKNDFFLQKNLTMGGVERKRVYNNKENYKKEQKKSEYNKKESKGDIYFDKIVKLCKENNIGLVTTYIPNCNASAFVDLMHIKQKIGKYGIDFIDFYNFDLVDYEIDFDDYDHLNVSGGRKITNYIGEYIKKNHNIPDRRLDKKYNHWNEKYIDYATMKIENINQQKDMNACLMNSYDKHFNILLQINDKKILNNAQTKKVIENLGVDLTKLKQDDLVYVDNKNGEIVYSKMTNEEKNTIKGKVRIVIVGQKTGEVLCEKVY